MVIKSDYLRLKVFGMTILRMIVKAATVSSNAGLFIQLGEGKLIVDPVRNAKQSCLAAYDYEPPFDVIAYSAKGIKYLYASLFCYRYSYTE
jgi:hypothetical protein